MFSSTTPPPVAVHYTTVFKYGAPVLCKSAEASRPATDDARYVTCDPCLALMTEGQRAERAAQARRLR